MTKNVNIRFDDEMHARLVTAAKRNRRSLNAQVETYCENGLDGDDLAEYPPLPSKEVHHLDSNLRWEDPS